MSRLAAFLAAEIEAGSFPGAAALVGSSQEILETVQAGEAAREPRRETVSGATLYDLASLTKPLCAGALAASLPDLALSSPPGRYLPGWKKMRFDGITVEHLLTHTSGLPAWFPLYVGGEGAAAYRRTLSQVPQEAAPGERVIYSDLNFLLLGEILEGLLSAPLDRAFDEIVGRPASSGARFSPPESAATAATEKDDATERAMTASLGLAYAHFRKGVVWGQVHDGNAFRRGGIAANAGLFATAPDVWALAREWMRGDRAGWCRDHTPEMAEARALSWQGRRGAGSAIDRMSARAFGHTGFTGTSLWIDPDADRIAILLTNRVHPAVESVDFNAVRRRFHELVYDEFTDSTASEAR